MEKDYNLLVRNSSGILSQPLNDSLGFRAVSVAVQNLTTEWLHFPDVNQYVPPYTPFQVVQLPGVVAANVNFGAPPGIFVSHALPGQDQYATLTFSDQQQSAQSTSQVATGGTQSVQVTNTLVVQDQFIGTGGNQVAGYVGMLLYGIGIEAVDRPVDSTASSFPATGSLASVTIPAVVGQAIIVTSIVAADRNVGPGAEADIALVDNFGTISGMEIPATVASQDRVVLTDLRLAVAVNTAYTVGFNTGVAGHRQSVWVAYHYVTGVTR